MFEIILLQICLLGTPTCAILEDTWGPYKTLEICETRIDNILDITTEGIDNYGYRAFCGQIDEDGKPVGELKQYLREGDSYKLGKSV